jgi:hypothetical protein
MKNLTLATLFALTITACATVRPIVGPDGTENLLVSAPSSEMAYEKAHEVCNGPYKIINTNSETSGFNGNTGSEIKMLIKCGH